MSNIVVLDIETTGLNPLTDKLHGIGVAWDEENIEYHINDDSGRIANVLSDPNAHVCGHNIRFDLKFLIRAGFQVNCRIWDTKILAQLVNENQELGLKALADKYIGKGSLENKSDLDRAVSKAGVKHVGDLCRLDIESDYTQYTELIARYCKEDCRNTLKLWHMLTTELKQIDASWKSIGAEKTPLDYFCDEAMPLEVVLMHMELAGISFNVDACRQYQKTLISDNIARLNQLNELCLPQIQAIEEVMYEAACTKRKSDKGKAGVLKSSEKYGTRFNWQSPDHIRRLFFSGLHLPSQRASQTASGQPSVGEESLEALAQLCQDGSKEQQIIETYKIFKKTQKLITTYTGEEKGLISHVQGGRIYADYLQAGRGKDGTSGGTVTGRLSSRNPNMQNLPRGSEIKKFFCPDPGHAFVYFDYSQLELRLAAHLSQDALLLAAYRNDRDLHQQTADELGITRQDGKTVNFAIIYDASAWRLSNILSLPPERCEEIRQNWFQLYSGYAQFLESQKRFMLNRGCIRSEAGRVRRLPELLQRPAPPPKEINHMIKQGYNFPIQSLGATITKRAMIELHNRGYHLVSQVHDSVILQVPDTQVTEAIREIQWVAEGIFPLTIPLKCDIKVLRSLSEEDKYERQPS